MAVLGLATALGGRRTRRTRRTKKKNTRRRKMRGGDPARVNLRTDTHGYSA